MRLKGKSYVKGKGCMGAKKDKRRWEEEGEADSGRVGE